MPGRPGASGQDRPGPKKYRFLNKIIVKSIGFEHPGISPALPRPGRRNLLQKGSFWESKNLVFGAAGTAKVLALPTLFRPGVPEGPACRIQFSIYMFAPGTQKRGS